jgi:DNA-binding NarL/FixJ family response regulator
MMKSSTAENQTPMIRILIVDDQRLIRESFRLMLASERGIEVVGVAETGQRAIEQVESLSPDVVLMDLVMPGIDGLTATRLITQRFPKTKVIILTGTPDNQALENAVIVGARGFLPKDVSAQELLSAIQAVSQGHSQFGPGLVEQLASRLAGLNLAHPQPTSHRDDLSTLTHGSLQQLLDDCSKLNRQLLKLEQTFEIIHAFY